MPKLYTPIATIGTEDTEHLHISSTCSSCRALGLFLLISTGAGYIELDWDQMLELYSVLSTHILKLLKRSYD